MKNIKRIKEFIINIPKSNWDKNIIKDIENTSFSNTTSETNEEDRRLIFAKAMVKGLGNNPIFAKKVAELKEKYRL